MFNLFGLVFVCYFFESFQPRNLIDMITYNFSLMDPFLNPKTKLKVPAYDLFMDMDLALKSTFCSENVSNLIIASYKKTAQSIVQRPHLSPH